MSFASHSPGEPTTTTDPSTSKDSPARSQVLQNVVENLAHSVFQGRKRSRPQFHAAGNENAEPSIEPVPQSTSSYAAYGRIFQRQSSSFDSVDNIVIEGIRHETADSDDETPLTVNASRMVQSWSILCNIIPNFRLQMIELSDDRKTRKAVCHLINTGASAARSDDTASLKANIIGYLLEDPIASRQLNLERTGKKLDRGFNHPVTASLLCPIKYPPTQETFQKIKDGLIVCNASALPCFLFPQGQIYDNEDIECGCFRGHLLLRVAKHVLQGPSSALQGPGFHRGQQGVASLCNITSMTPPLLSYLAIQTHFALSSAPTWARRIGSFDYNEFYWNLMDILQGPEGEEIIALFNHHVFGQSSGSNTPSMDSEESDFDRIKQQRAAKRMRTVESFTTTSPDGPGAVATDASQSEASNATGEAGLGSAEVGENVAVNN